MWIRCWMRNVSLGGNMALDRKRLPVRWMTFFGRTALNRHALVLDAALDAWQLEEWARRRDADPEGWALAVATDESPPSQARFGGLRFQVTLVYAPVWRPENTWDHSADPPLDAESYLADICHCPGKDGVTVMGSWTNK